MPSPMSKTKAWLSNYKVESKAFNVSKVVLLWDQSKEQDPSGGLQEYMKVALSHT